MPLSLGYGPELVDLSSERLLLSRVWASPPEIYRSETTLGVRYTSMIEGRKFLLRSDFPVVLFVDGKAIGAAGAPAFPPFYRFNFGRASIRQRVIEFRFPRTWGGDPAGGLAAVQAEILGRHGVCCLDAAWSDEADPQPPDPDLLPLFTVSTNHLSLSAENFIQVWGTVTNLQEIFEVPASGSNRLPNEFFVKQVAVDMDIQSNWGTIPGIRPYRYRFFKNNLPVGDTQNFFILRMQQGEGMAEAFPIKNAKLPLRSIFAPYAAEVPNLSYQMDGTINNIVSLQGHSSLLGSYLI